MEYVRIPTALQNNYRGLQTFTRYEIQVLVSLIVFIFGAAVDIHPNAEVAVNFEIAHLSLIDLTTTQTFISVRPCFQTVT